ncbi:MAG TPA: PepSY domain-containing protein [Longimicrobiales bacterium]
MRIPILLGSIALLGLSGAIAFAKLNQSVEEEQSGLLARATYSVEAARKQALAAVPGGVVVESEIEEEHGRLIYSFEIKVAGQDGVTEVEIDAMTGELIGTEHESDEDDGEEDERDDDSR